MSYLAIFELQQSRKELYPLIAEEGRVSLEERVDALAHVIRQSFEPPEFVADDMMCEVVAPRMLAFFEQIITDVSQQLQMAMSL